MTFEQDLPVDAQFSNNEARLSAQNPELGGAEMLKPRRVLIRHGDRVIEVFVDPPCLPRCGGLIECYRITHYRGPRVNIARRMSQLHGGLPIVDLVKGTPRGGPSRVE